jgi:hypothetical protein
MKLYRRDREIHLLYPRAPPRATFVYLPKEKIVVTGDAVIGGAVHGRRLSRGLGGDAGRSASTSRR